jgi:hypothetical protein
MHAVIFQKIFLVEKLGCSQTLSWHGVEGKILSRGCNSSVPGCSESLYWLISRGSQVFSINFLYISLLFAVVPSAILCSLHQYTKWTHIGNFVSFRLTAGYRPMRERIKLILVKLGTADLQWNLSEEFNFYWNASNIISVLHGARIERYLCH